jgi:large subunit ribosomal protein L13
MKVIDAKDLILGRLASYVSKELLEGEEITIVNAEECVISGSRRYILEKYGHRRKRRSVINPARHGPFFPRRPEGIVRRAIRGMLPYKKAKGREAMKRLKVYVGIPEDLKDKVDNMKIPSVNKLSIPKYMKIKEISELLGAK